MRDEKIVESYNKIVPDEEAKNRMYTNILEHKNKDLDTNRTFCIRKEFRMKKMAVAIMMLICICLISGTGYAAYKWLNSKEAAEAIGDKKLAQYFGKKESDIEVQESGEYRIAYLGTVSGKDISDIDLDENKKKTYAAIAVERKDGKPMKEDSDIVVASPFIKGIDPNELNIYTMGGGVTWKIIDGVYYAIAECDDLQMFADKGMYLAAMDGPCMKEGYTFDQQSGQITAKESYQGLNALFEVKLDPSKADAKKAKAYLERLKNGESDNDGYTESTDVSVDEKKIEGIDLNNTKDVLKHSKYLKDSEKELIPDKEGMVTYSYKGEFEVNSMVSQLVEGKSDLNILYGDEKDYTVEIIKKDGKIYGRTYEFLGK